ncbi:NAD(P)/FAD-dependent oxidoreductase [Halobium palmae]|uniref:NAD(P)/FAD-dependent oxidoreductase n=1 Tax=Halobium palmae TaxID=1776492 RepID=A0ABD5RWX5_9EURY
MAYDVTIIGTGPAGLTAGQYAYRRGLDTLILEKEGVGGELVNRHHIETYPGFPDGISGPDLRSKLVAELEEYDAEVRLTEVEGITPGDPHTIRTGGEEYESEAVILATGGEHSDLDVEGEERYDGHGVFYCAQCDGPLYRDEHIAVVGGSDHALGDALFLTKFASSVTVVSRQKRLSAGEHLRERAESNSKIEIMLDTEVTGVEGENGLVNGLTLVDGETDEEQLREVGGLYVCVGLDPNTMFLEGVVPLTEKGSVVVGSDLMTGVDGIYAAGDVRQHSGREVTASVGDGAVAARSVARHLEHSPEASPTE